MYLSLLKIRVVYVFGYNWSSNNKFSSKIDVLLHALSYHLCDMYLPWRAQTTTFGMDIFAQTSNHQQIAVWILNCVGYFVWILTISKFKVEFKSLIDDCFKTFKITYIRALVDLNRFAPLINLKSERLPNCTHQIKSLLLGFNNVPISKKITSF